MMSHRILALVAFALLVPAAGAQPPEASLDPLATTVLDRVGQSDTPACVIVGLVEGSKSRVAFGCTRDAGPVALDRDSLFEIGSIAKGLTGLLLADMVKRGEVSLDDPASKYSRRGARLPRRGSREITLRDLVTHTSGLPRLPPGLRPADPANPYADFGADKLYAALARTQLTRDIGAQYEYSNFAFMWLSDLLARRAGKRFDALLKERVLDPLGMKDTTLVPSEEQAKRAMTGHALPYEPTSPWDLPPEVSGVGGWRATMNDMLKLAEALAGVRDTPLKDAIALAVEPMRAAFGRNSIGFAWITHEGPAARVVWHNGGTGGFTSMIAVNRAAKKAAVALADTAAPFEDLALNLVDPDTPLRKKREALPLEASEREQYAGRYQLAPQFEIRVFVDGERLMGQGTGQPPFEMGREGPDAFFVRGIDARLVFSRAPDGHVDGVTLLQAGQETFAQRLP